MPVTKKAPSKAKKATQQQEEVNKLGPFEFHGVNFTPLPNGQMRADCPFCEKENHFYANPKTGQWDCKRCGENGNIYSFLSLLYLNTLKQTTSKHYKELAKARSLPVEAFQGNDVLPAYSPERGRWYFPVFSSEKVDTLVGLRVWDGPSKPVFATTGTSQHLIDGQRFLSSQDKIVYVTEGEWDGKALEWLRTTCKEPGIVVSTPSANTFKEKWLDLFKGKIVVFIYDNDDPGKAGQIKAAQQVSKAGVALGIKTVLWPSVIAEGYDLNDFVKDRVRGPKGAWKELQGMLVDFVDTDAPAVEDKPAPKVYARIPPFKEVVREYSKNFHTDKNSRDTLAIMLATGLSTKIPGDPVWLFIVGPPGCGKTLMISSMLTSELAHFESNLSPHTLISGWRMDNPDDDPSLLPYLKDRILVLKDYTEIRSKSRQEQEEIYGVLRGAFDGTAQRTFANGQVRRYENTHFTMIAGTTHEIHGDNRASLGERFLKCEFLGDSHNPGDHIRAAIGGMAELAEKEMHLRELVAAFLSQSVPEKLPTVPTWVIDRLVALAQVVAYLRASVDYSHSGELNYRPRSEVGTRLAKQLIKLCQSLAIVFKLKTIDKECYRLAEKVAFDTATGFHLDILRSLMRVYPTVLSVEEVAKASQLGKSTAEKKLTSLLELKAVKRERIKPETPPSNGKQYKKPGQPAYGYQVSPHLAKLWQQAKIDSSNH